MNRRTGLGLGTLAVAILGAGVAFAHNRYQLAGPGWRAEFTNESRMLHFSGSVIRMDLENSHPWPELQVFQDRIRYRGMYPGIHLDYYRAGSELEFNFVVEPGADPRRIEMSFAGAQGVHIDSYGNLVLQTRTGPVRQKAPVAFQMRHGRREYVRTRFVQTGPRQVAYAIGVYDRTHALIIG